MPKEAHFELQMPPGNSHLNLWLETNKVTALGASKTLGDVNYVDGFILVILALCPLCTEP